MIKLNNKNITYVALADTNNSIKAPKEIWYADSPNSVKLVYRRKDALIEGEDYEKYHWLVGDADAYINTLKYYHPYDDSVQMTFRDNLYPNRADKRNKHNAEEQIWGSSINDDGLVIRSYISGTTDIRIGNNILNAAGSSVNWFGYTINGYINDSEYHNLYISDVTDNKYSFTYNGSQKDNLSTINTLPDVVQSDVLVFSSNQVTNGYFNGSFFNFIHYRNNVEITHLTPCKLLKPVPKWLDANGIRRQVGECGMIDLVSGKFYGNVNSNGTFTVENYYERKEWLVGDGSAYIDTGHNVNEDLDYETKAYLLPNTYLFWYRSGNPYKDQTMVVRSNTSTYIGTRVAKNSTTVNVSDIANVEVQWNNNEVSINGVDYIPIDKAITFDCELYLFYAYLKDVPNIQDEYTSNNVKCSYFRFLDSNRDYILNLIPCTLTMDLPASMDANNIARTKGMSGMWDLVSDRFYGNVANSGTFNAVNLAEGVDYEVHQWLKTGSGYPHIQVAYGYNTDNGAYIETRYKCNYSNSGFDMIVGFSANQNNNIGIRIFNANNNTYIDYHKTENGVLSSSRTIKSQNNINVERYIKATLNNLIIDDTEYPSITWGSAFNTNINRQGTILYTNQGDNDMHYAETKLRVNNIEYDLIPVKLLRSIPAKYDANGIARNAGECGMYDMVNDVFYGNVVASSGSFTVSDN